MNKIARPGLILITSVLFSMVAAAQTGPAGPQVILGASTAKLNVGQKKLGGHVIAMVRVGDDGQVLEARITENTADPGLESQLLRVLQSARFRPAIDESGRLIESGIEMKVELLQSTGSEPKPVAANPDPDRADKERLRIQRMRCSDFVWEWNLIRKVSSTEAMEFMPRIAVSMYASKRSEAGEYVDAKVWKESAKGLKRAADDCEQNPNAPFWDGIFRSVMDEAVPR